MAETSATAEGDIARTPFAHLLIYALDRALSGAIFLSCPDGVEHAIRLVRGVPVKVRPGDRHALLGEMLVEAGAIDQATLEAALKTNSLLGDVLLLAGCVQRDLLEAIAEKQLVRRIVRFFDLPPGTTYRYFDGHPELADYGGDPACVDPLALLWSGLSAHAERSAMMESTLALLGDKPMKLHPLSTASRFCLESGEAKLLDHLTVQPATLAELVALGAAPPEAVRRLAYALMITRQLDTGAGTTPLGAVDSSRTPNLTGAGPTAFARMQLKSTVHRVGAAAPDAPGDGERGAATVVARSSTRRRALDPRAEVDGEGSFQPDPPSSHERISGDPSIERSSNGGAEPARDSGVMEVPGPVRAERAYVTTTMRSQRAPELTPADAGIVEEKPPGPAGNSGGRPPSAAGAEPPPVPAGHDRGRPPGAPDLERSQISAGKSVAELMQIARSRFAERDPKGALVACDEARAAAPDDADVIAFGAWVRVHAGSADLKALEIELDELLAAAPQHVDARYYRAMVRKRLGNQPGCAHDLRHVLEADPAHADATRELAALAPAPVVKERPSLFGRLFRR